MAAVVARMRQVTRGMLVRTPVRELFVRRRTSRYVTVVNYHRVHPPVGPDYPFNAGVMEATPELFARQLRYLRRNLDLITMREFVAGLQEPKRLPPRPGLITFDDGYRDAYDVALPLLRESGVPACFFLITGLVGTAEAPWPDQVVCCLKLSCVPRLESPFGVGDPPYDVGRGGKNGHVVRFLRNAKRVKHTRLLEILAWLREATGVNPREHVDRPLILSWDQVRRMMALGMDIGGHTRTHPALAGIDDPAVLRDEVRGCYEDIVAQTGVVPQAFAYPFGLAWTMSAAAEAEVGLAGFRAAFSLADTFAPRPPAGNPLCIPRLRAKENCGFAEFRLTLACGERPAEAQTHGPSDAVAATPAEAKDGIARPGRGSVQPARPAAESPPITVVMAAYNAEKYLAQAVNSILRQTFSNFDVVIVNDGSTDRTGDILDSFARRDARIRVVTQANAGVAAALNTGLARARGEYIARMDADDMSLPTRLEKQLAFMKAHPDCVAVGCRWLAIDPDCWPIRIGYQPETHQAIDAFHLAGNGGGMCGPALFLRRAAVEAVGRYRHEFRLAEDYDLLLRLAEFGRVENLSDVLFLYREHESSLLRTRREELKRLTWKAQKEAHERRGLPFDRPPPPPVDPWAPRLHLRWARYALAAEYFRTARRHAWRHFLKTRSAKPLRILAEATVRQAAEPWLWVYDLLRFRRPRSRSRVNDPIRSERLVRAFGEEMARGLGADPAKAAVREHLSEAPERCDRDVCVCAAGTGRTD